MLSTKCFGKIGYITANPEFHRLHLLFFLIFFFIFTFCGFCWEEEEDGWEGCIQVRERVCHTNYEAHFEYEACQPYRFAVSSYRNGTIPIGVICNLLMCVIFVLFFCRKRWPTSRICEVLQEGGIHNKSLVSFTIWWYHGIIHKFFIYRTTTQILLFYLIFLE